MGAEKLKTDLRRASQAVSPRAQRGRMFTPILPEELVKYRKMKNFGVGKSGIMNQMRKDGIEPSRYQEIENFEKSLQMNNIDMNAPFKNLVANNNNGGAKNVTQNTSAPEKKPDVPDDLKKYAKMLKIGMPKVSVINKMRMDGVDPKRLGEIDGTAKPKPPSTESTEKKKVAIPEELKKYHKMLTLMKVPQHVVENKMKMEGVNPERIWEINGKTKPGAEKVVNTVPKELEKYHKMLNKMGMPAHVVQNRMRIEGIDPKRISEIDGSATVKKAAPKADDVPKELKKYWMMLIKMKVPVNNVINKMKQDGIDPKRIQEIDSSIDVGQMEKKAKDAAKQKLMKERRSKFNFVNMGKPIESDFWKQTMSAEEVFGESYNEEELMKLFGKPPKRSAVAVATGNGTENGGDKAPKKSAKQKKNVARPPQRQGAQPSQYTTSK